MESQPHTHEEIPTDPSPATAATTEEIETEQRQKEALAAFTATLHSVGANLEAPLRERAAIINSNAGSLERQEAELAGQSSQLAKQNESWERMNDETREGLKEIGDVQNWAEMIERDLLVLESMMDDVDGDEMSVDGSLEHEHEHDGVAYVHENGNGNGNGNMDVEINGNGNATPNGDGDGVKKGKKEKRKSWFFWW
ncbi:hypothetical protein N7478_002989 [Penicillium angulare]|uniref:uncharacterized protein n=1 Tax=Penicillium angulare TaxID=116970 RepID=UPI0025420C15|nr:uncharacterized protein N7478_002989 [Penicillium angulare]KAJ5287303.1 hypothetical protein N7478_002989 [Penicillium angulare]